MQNSGRQMNGGLLRILRILSTLGLPLLWAVCVFVPCAVSVFSSAHCCLPSPLHSPPPITLFPCLQCLPHLATSTQAPEGKQILLQYMLAYSI